MKLVPKRKLVSGLEATPDMIIQEYTAQPEITMPAIPPIPPMPAPAISPTHLIEHTREIIRTEVKDLSGPIHRLWVEHRLRIPVGKDKYD